MRDTASGDTLITHAVRTSSVCTPQSLPLPQHPLHVRSHVKSSTTGPFHAKSLGLVEDTLPQHPGKQHPGDGTLRLWYDGL